MSRIAPLCIAQPCAYNARTYARTHARILRANIETYACSIYALLFVRSITGGRGPHRRIRAKLTKPSPQMNSSVPCPLGRNRALRRETEARGAKHEARKRKENESDNSPLQRGSSSPLISIVLKKDALPAHSSLRAKVDDKKDRLILPITRFFSSC